MPRKNGNTDDFTVLAATAASELAVNRRTILRMIERGELVAQRVPIPGPKAAYLVSRRSLDDLKQKRSQPAS